MDLEQERAVVVGVNRFTAETETRPPLHHVDPEVGRRQAAKLAALRQRRDNEVVTQKLCTLQHAATTSTNLMPLLIAAVEEYATLGEISDALRQVFGEQREFRSLE